MTSDIFTAFSIGALVGVLLTKFIAWRHAKRAKHRWWPPEPETEDSLRIKLARLEGQSKVYEDRDNARGDGNAVLKFYEIKAGLRGEVAATKAQLEILQARKGSS